MNYWVVGASWGGTEDVSEEFLKKNIWYDGYANNGDNQNESYLNDICIGDILIMKSSATKGPGHSISFTKVKGVGIVKEKIKWYQFKIKWLNVEGLPKDFDNVSYRKTIEIAREDNLYKFVKAIIEKENMKSIIELLENKHQIILQGAPGVGKTRLAELLAQELIKPVIAGKPIDIIDKFFKDFNPSDPLIQSERIRRKKLLADFKERFPVAQLKNLTLDDYCTGKGDRNNFCWWIETGLKSLGKYAPGSARSYLIYWNKDELLYRKHGKLVKDIEDDKKAMEQVASYLNKVVQLKQIDDSAAEYFGDSFLLKILNSYYPDDYFPINGNDYLENALKLFGIDSRDRSKIEKNLLLIEKFNEKKKKIKSDVDPFEFAEFLFKNFNLKTGEDLDNNSGLVIKGEYKIIQFHPAYTYEDFVRGISAKSNNGQIEYITENRVLADYAQLAIDNPRANYVLIIDEINRANLPAVLGELIYALEYRDKDVDVMYKLENESKITLPKNLFIIGTMNTADRSVGHIDYAIRRRFAFVDLLPQKAVVEEHGCEEAVQLFIKTSELFCKDYADGMSMTRSDYLSPEFLPEDVMIGHSYFLEKDIEKLKMRIKYEVKPILKEYLKDGILLESAREIIEKL